MLHIVLGLCLLALSAIALLFWPGLHTFSWLLIAALSALYVVGAVLAVIGRAVGPSVGKALDLINLSQVNWIAVALSLGAILSLPLWLRWV